MDRGARKTPRLLPTGQVSRGLQCGLSGNPVLAHARAKLKGEPLEAATLQCFAGKTYWTLSHNIYPANYHYLSFRLWRNI